jgi:hypothetical protein
MCVELEVAPVETAVLLSIGWREGGERVERGWREEREE